MAFDENEIAASFAFDEEKLKQLKAHWLDVMQLLMFGDVGSKKIGALPRSRKRLLEVGESFGSFISSKTWIDQPRQQLKSALGSSVKLRDSLSALGLVNKHITEGADAENYQQEVKALELGFMTLLMHHENLWASILDGQDSDVEDSKSSEE